MNHATNQVFERLPVIAAGRQPFGMVHDDAQMARLFAVVERNLERMQGWKVVGPDDDAIRGEMVVHVTTVKECYHAVTPKRCGLPPVKETTKWRPVPKSRLKSPPSANANRCGC